MSSEKKPLTYREMLQADLGPVDQNKSLKQILTEQITEENPLRVTAEEALVEARAQAEQAAADARTQSAYDAGRTAAGDTARANAWSSGRSPFAPSRPTQVATQALQQIAEGAPAPAGVSEIDTSAWTPEEKTAAEEAELAFDIAYKAIKEESDSTNILDTLASFTPVRFTRGAYRALTDGLAPGQAGGSISRAYKGLSRDLEAIKDPAKKARVQANVREILEKEGGVEVWQGTDAEDKQSYISSKVIDTIRVGPNKEKVAEIYSVINNATDRQFDASATFSKLRHAYMQDFERAYRGDNPEVGGGRLPDEVFAEITASAEQKARGDIARIKTVAQPHVFVDTGASDLVAEYRAQGDTDALAVLKGRTLDALFVRPKVIDQVYEQAAGVDKALPGTMIAATVLGRALEVLSLQEQGAMQVEVFADVVNEAVQQAQDPNDPTAVEVAAGAARGLGQAALTAPVSANWLRTSGLSSMLTPEGEDPEEFMMEADARLLDAATDNRDFFDTFAFTLPVLASAPFGRDAQAEVITKALEYHDTAKASAFLAAIVLPDTSPLGAAASYARQGALWAAKKARFSKWTADLGRLESAVDTAGTPEDLVRAAKDINLATGQIVEAALLREETKEQVGAVVSVLAEGGDSAGEAVSKAKLSDEATKEAQKLNSLKANNASADAIRRQAQVVEDAVKKDFEKAQSALEAKAKTVMDIEDVVEAAAKETDDSVVAEAVKKTLAKAKSSVADEGEVKKVAKTQTFDEDRVKNALQDHPKNVAKIEKALQDNATDEDILDAVLAIHSVATSERKEVLQSYAKALRASAEKIRSTDQHKNAVAASKALEKVRTTIDEINRLGTASPSTKAFIDAQVESTQAAHKLAQATAEVQSKQNLTRLLSPQAAKDEVDALVKKGVLALDEAQTVAAIKVAKEEGDNLRVPSLDLFRAQDALRIAQEEAEAAAKKAAQARAQVPAADIGQAVALARGAVDALKEAGGKADVSEAVAELQQRAQRALVGVNGALAQEAAARAVAAVHDRATRREVLVITRLLRKRSDLLLRPEVMGPVKQILKRASYSEAEEAALKEEIIDEVPSILKAVADLSAAVRRQRAVGQMVSWRDNARKIVQGMRAAGDKLRERSDVSWTDLGWRSGEIAEVTRLRSRAGGAVEDVLRETTPEDFGGNTKSEAVVQGAAEALRRALGREAATPSLDALAGKVKSATTEVTLDKRAVQVAAQADIDLAMRKVMSEDEATTLFTMQAAWTEKAFLYQMKAFLDPMASYIGTSSQGLRNVYRGVVGVSQMYFTGLNGAVRKAAEEIRSEVASGRQENRKEVFAVLMKHINAYMGTADTVSDRGAAIAGMSIFERTKRALIEEAPAEKGGKAAVAAVSDADRDLLRAMQDTRIELPGGLSEADAKKALAKKEIAVEKAKEALEAAKQREAALRASAAVAAAPDPKHVAPQVLNDMNLAAMELAAKRDEALQEVERIKAADPIDFLDETPFGTKMGELKKLKEDIKVEAEDLKFAEEGLRLREAYVEELKARRDAITKETLGAKKTRQVPDDENLLLPSALRERLASSQKNLAAAQEEMENVQALAQDRARANPDVLREWVRLNKVEEEAQARLAAAKQKFAEIPEKGPLGGSSQAHRAKRTRAANLVAGIEKEVRDLQEQAQAVVDAQAAKVMQDDSQVKAAFEKANRKLEIAAEKAKKAQSARDEALAKAKAAPVLASPDEVKAARKVIQDEIDLRVATDIKAAKKAISDLDDAVTKTQRKIDNISKQYAAELGDDAAKMSLLGAFKKKKLEEAEKKLEETTKLARDEAAKVRRVTEASDASAVEAAERKAKAMAQLEEADELQKTLSEMEAKVIEVENEAVDFADRLTAARRSAAEAAREVAIARLKERPGHLEAVERLASAETGQVDPDMTLVRLGMSVFQGIQQAPERVQAAEMARLAESVARQALSTSNSFEEMYGKMLGLWSARFDVADAVIGQDAKSMAFAATAMIEGATRDLAVDATLREGIGLVDPRAAKAMAQISRLANGTLKTSDITANDVKAALLGFGKIGQIWNRTVEGRAVTFSVLSSPEKSDRSLGLFLASVRDVEVDNQTIYLPRALSEAMASEMDLMRKEIDRLPAQNPNTLVNKWLVETTRDLLRFMRTTMLIGYGVNLLGYRARTLMGDVEQMYYAIDGKKALQAAVAAPLQMIPFKGAVVVDAAHRGAGQLAGKIRAGVSEHALTGLPAPVQKIAREVGNPLADFVQGTFDPNIGKIIASVASDPQEKITIGKVTKSRAAWLEEAARQGAFDTNVEAGMRKTVRDVRDMIGQVTSRRMTWADAVAAGRERGESPYKIYLMRQRTPLKEDEVLSKPGTIEKMRVALVENQRALEAREADVQRTTRQMLYLRLRQQGLSEQEAGEAMRRGLLDWSHGLNRTVAGVIAYMPFWRYHLLSFKQGFSLLFGDGKGASFDRAQKLLRAYDGLYEGAPTEEEVSLVKERARNVARAIGRSEEDADKEVSTFLAAKQFALGNVPRFIRDGGSAYSVSHVSGVDFGDLGSGLWQANHDKVEQARRDYRDPGDKATTWRATSRPRSSIIGAMDVAATMALLMDAAHAYASDDVQASEAALLKAGTPVLGRTPDLMREIIEKGILSLDPVANAAYGGNRAYADYGRLTPAEADIAELLGIPLVNTQDDPRPMAPKAFKWLFSLPLVGVSTPVVGQARDVYKAAKYTNPYAYDESSLKQSIGTPLAVWGLMRSYSFDPLYSQSLEDAATSRAAAEVVKQAEQGTRFYQRK